MKGKASVVVVVGARGTGKTQWLKRHYAAAPAVAVWDYKHDPGLEDFGQPVTTMREFLLAIQAPRFRVRYLVNREADVPMQFTVYCRAIFQRGNIEGFVDELAATQASQGELKWRRAARAAWQECVMTGRQYRGKDGRLRALGLGITAQRMGEIDTTLKGNVDVIHVGRLPQELDARTAAGLLGGVPWQTIATLPNLHYIEQRMDGTPPRRGLLTFGNAPKKKATSGRRLP